MRFLFFGIAFLYIVWNVFIFAHTPTRAEPDTEQYREVSTYPLFSTQFWLDWRPTVTPLIFKLLQRNDQAIVIFQLLVGLGSWLLLAYAASRWVERPVVKVGGFAAILLLGSATDFSLVYRLLLTEGIAYTLFTLMLAIWFLAMDYVRQRPPLGPRAQVALGLGLWLSMSVWSVSRYPHAYVLMGAAVGMAFLWLVFWRQTAAWRYILPVVVLGSVGTYFFQSIPVNQSDYWKQGMMNALSTKVLPYPERRDFLIQRGMPSDAEALKYAGYLPARYAGPWEPIFEDWMINGGRKAYFVDYVALQPLARFGEIVENWELIFSPDMVLWTLSRRTAGSELAAWQYEVNYLYYDPSAFGYFLMAIPTLLLVLILMWQLRRLPWQFVPPLAILGLSLPLAMAIWYGDGYYERVVIGLSQQTKLGVLLLAIFSIDFALGWKRALAGLILLAGVLEIAFGVVALRNTIFPLVTAIFPQTNVLAYWGVADAEYQIYQHVPFRETVISLQQQEFEDEIHYRDFVVHWSEERWGELRNDLDPNTVDMAWRNTPRVYGPGVSPEGPVWGGFRFEPELGQALFAWRKTRLPEGLLRADIGYVLVDSAVYETFLPYQARLLQNPQLYRKLASWEMDGTRQDLYQVVGDLGNFDAPRSLALSEADAQAYEAYNFSLIPEGAVVFNPAQGNAFKPESDLIQLLNVLDAAPPPSDKSYFWDLLTLLEWMKPQEELTSEQQALASQWRNSKDPALLAEIDYLFFEMEWMSWLSDAEIADFESRYELVFEWRGQTPRTYRLYRVP